MSGLGVRLKALRQARGLSQQQVADGIGTISRATVSQWEGGRHLPSAENLAKLDQLFGELGRLVDHAENIRAEVDRPEIRRTRDLGAVFSDIADALVRSVRTVPIEETGGTFTGWSHNLPDNRPTPLSSAYAIRTLQLLDDARADLHAVGTSILGRRNAEGTWSNRKELTFRPETTAVILAALAGMGMLDDVDGSLDRLGAGLDDYARSRPYILAVMLESVLRIDPTHGLVGRLVEALLAARTDVPGAGALWAQTTTDRPDLLEPSLPHTARAVAVLRTVPGPDDGTRRAVDHAIGWMVDRPGDDDGTTEMVDPAPDVAGGAIPFNHFPAPWCVRALLGRDDVPTRRVAHSLDVVWRNFDSAREHLWCWRADLTFPSWMTLDGVIALRQAALAAFPTPLVQLETDGAHAPHTGDR